MTLQVERIGRVAILTLDDVGRRNALTPTLVDEIVAATAELESDESIGALIITGAPPSFCSGADLGNLTALGEHDPGAVRSIYEGFLRIYNCSLPTIAAVNGPAVGAGLNLALACDLRLAGTQARFDARFMQIGLHPGGGHVWLLERAIGPQAAAAMNLFGERLTGRRAVELGLAWECLPDDALLDRAVELAGRAADAPRELASRVKDTLRKAPWQPGFDDAVQYELDHQVWSFRQPYFAERLRSTR
ncbi:MAG: enoyl-CoA hydratase [Acidimicrobiia bacterium]|nr:enoyl-CoA hydratase [Acidimicrobiia bacterium]